jgi:thymidylate kinase
VVVDGNDGTGKSTLVETLRARGFTVKDRGVPTHMTDHPDGEPVVGEVYIILDAPIRVSRQRLESAGKDLNERYHTEKDLQHYRTRFKEVAAELPRCALVDAQGEPGTVLERTLTALERLGVRSPE